MNEIKEFLFLHVTSTSSSFRNRNERVESEEEVVVSSVLSFMLNKSHPFKFLLIKVIKNSISYSVECRLTSGMMFRLLMMSKHFIGSLFAKIRARKNCSVLEAPQRSLLLS